MLEFNSIPLTIRTPGAFVEFDNTRAQKSLAPWDTRIMVLGQKLGAGSAASLMPVPINAVGDGAAAFGRGSMLDRMILALQGVNKTTELWAMAVPQNVAGVAATYVTTFTAIPTGAGTLSLYIGGAVVQIAVAAAEPLATLATALAAAINADPDLPVSAVAAGAVVNSTVAWKGESGNYVDFRVNFYASDALPAGLALNTAAGVAGSGNPDIGPALAAIGDKQCHTIVCPWTDGANLAALATEMADRRGPLEMIEGMAYCSAKGSLGSLQTLGAAQNSPDISISECVGPVTPWERAAREAGVIALYGAIDPARPFQTLSLAGDIAPNDTERFTRAERDGLLHDGISTHTVDAGGNVLLERPITTYQLNGAGVPDDSYLDVNTMITLAYLRFTWRVRMATKFPRCKLTDDSTVAPGQAMVNTRMLAAEQVCLARDWELAGLVENIDEFKSLLIVERDPTDRSRVNSLIPPDIVSGLRVNAGQIQFAF
ncbi:MAG: phage tail sheath subtilisin-like domain-containing protein [Caulobacteraceae bacterium]